MNENSITDFVQNLRAILNNTEEKSTENCSNYLDLGENNQCSLEQLELSQQSLPKDNPIHLAFSQIFQSLRNNHFDRVKLGLNEIIQYYLLNSGENHLGRFSKEILEHIYLIVLYFTHEAFPFDRYFFNYLTKCYQSACSFLLSGHKNAEIQLFTDHIVAVGKIVSQKQMDTCGIHLLLRNIETFAMENHLMDLADKARNSRHTLEI
ncbi:MAG TPA: hypothetical protein GX691_04950 [Clostridia bacterium]|nr:hypothetical protein [Clostridia bacterium]